MGISRLGERGVIQFIRDMQRSLPDGVIGIGDDAAFLPASAAPSGWLISQDMLVESQHFRWDWATPEQVGRKAAEVNLSDIAAMGGDPVAALTSVAIPRQCTVDQVRGVYQGLTAALGRYGVPIIGGDTVGSPNTFVLDVTILGKPGPRGPIGRKGARPGDRLLVSGWLGSSYAGFLLLSRGVRAPASDQGQQLLLTAHLVPEARVELAREIAPYVTAMTDISDGLAAEIPEMLMPGQGAEVHLDQLPIAPEARALADTWQGDVKAWAVYGGEDYELLIAAAPSAIGAIQRQAERLGIPLTEIGWVTDEEGICWRDQGRVVSVKGEGIRFEHF
ncbi:MAG: thiamine-phosphate kinase [Firmicutes bacterium]|nr:thiamine-phosphate kinase [Bacillota bacterium]